MYATTTNAWDLTHIVRYISPASQSITNTPFKSLARYFSLFLSRRDILLPSIEIVHEPSKSRDLCDCLREYASYIRSLTCMYIRRNCAFLSIGRDSGWGPWGKGRRERPYGEARDDRDANSFCSLPRLLRPFLRMQIVGGRGSSWNAFRGRARGRKNKGAEDYEYISFTISEKIDAKHSVILLCSSCESLLKCAYHMQIFTRLVCR